MARDYCSFRGKSYTGRTRPRSRTHFPKRSQPMNFIEEMRAKAKANPRKLVLPEGYEARTLKAARIILDERVRERGHPPRARRPRSRRKRRSRASALPGLHVEEPATSPLKKEYVDDYFELRKSKGISREDAEKVFMGDTQHWGAMMMRKGTGRCNGLGRGQRDGKGAARGAHHRQDGARASRPPPPASSCTCPARSGAWKVT